MGLGLYTFRIEPQWVEFTHHVMKLPNLTENLIGKTIVQISDIHIGKRFDWSYMKAAFEKVTKLNPDIVLYTGDYITYSSSDEIDELRKAAIYFPKGKLATLASLGNHDYGRGWSQSTVADEVVNILNSNKISVLRNQSIDIDGLTIVGLEDYWGINWDSEVAFKTIKTENPSLILCHNPDVCDLPIWGDFKGYILAGHTHGGQVKPPFLQAPMLPVKNKRYAQGLIQLDEGRTLYINRAIGCLWPVRFNVRPEVTIFTLA